MKPFTLEDKRTILSDEKLMPNLSRLVKAQNAYRFRTEMAEFKKVKQ